MNILFVPYEIALLAKNNNFNEECFKMSQHKKECVNKVNGDCPLHNLHCCFPDCEIDKSTQSIGIPLYQQLIDWFREYPRNIKIIEDERFVSTGKDNLYYIKQSGSNIKIGLYSLNDALKEAFKIINE